MPPITQAELDRLELSDDQRAVFQRMLSDNQEKDTRLAEVARAARTTTVEARVKELQGKGFSPGFCAEYERIALGDDGNPAVVLNLSENGVSRQVEHTATQVADRLIAAMPFDTSGKLALAEQANLLESPIGTRPALSDADARKAAGEKEGPKTGEDLLADWEKADPKLIADFRTKLADPAK